MSKYKHKLSVGIKGMWEKQRMRFEHFFSFRHWWVRDCSTDEIAGSNSAGDGCQSLARVACCKVEVSETDRSLVERSPTVCVCNSV